MSSIYGGILRGVILPIGDWVRGVPIGQVLDFLETSQWWTPAELRKLQNRKLAELVRTAYETTGYYRRMMDAARLKPSDFLTVDDLAKLPLLTKKVIRDQYPAELINRTIPKRHLVTHRTGGSTGEPLFFSISRQGRAFDRASYYRFLRWCGGGRGETLFTVWGQLVVAESRFRFVDVLKRRLITRSRSMDAFRMTPETMTEFMSELTRKRATILRGYTSALVELSRFVEGRGCACPDLKAVATTAEQVLPEQRRLMERVFGVPVFDQYGCGETGGIAYECPQHSGLHIAAEHCIVEIVDDEGNPLPPGRTGRVALTNLDNEATPFIRYLNGDEAALLTESCPCGRGLPLMSSVAGRTSDMIHGVNGNRAHGEFFTHLVHELGWTERLGVREFQVVQTHKDRLRFRVVSASPPSKEEWARLTRQIKDYLGEMDVDCQEVEKIDRSRSGKLRFTVREWDPAGG